MILQHLNILDSLGGKFIYIIYYYWHICEFIDLWKYWVGYIEAYYIKWYNNTYVQSTRSQFSYMFIHLFMYIYITIISSISPCIWGYIYFELAVQYVCRLHTIIKLRVLDIQIFRYISYTYKYYIIIKTCFKGGQLLHRQCFHSYKHKTTIILSFYF